MHPCRNLGTEVVIDVPQSGIVTACVKEHSRGVKVVIDVPQSGIVTRETIRCLFGADVVIDVPQSGIVTFVEAPCRNNCKLVVIDVPHSGIVTVYIYAYQHKLCNRRRNRCTA